MTRRGWPRNCLILAAVCMCSVAKAGVWVTEPVLGLAADYSTNPALLLVDHTAETHGAVLIDTPTTYHAEDISVAILPSFRISNSPGYSSIASDYAHLAIRGEIDSDLDSLTVTGRLARDSSLYYNYSLNGSTGVRSDTELADIAWVRALSERLNLNVDASSNRVVYGDSTTTTTLTDYRYTSLAPSLAWTWSPRTTLSLDSSGGLYVSTGGATKSVNSQLELGIVRRVNELWSVNATAGYSRESNSIDEFYGPYLLGNFKSTTTGTVFQAKITRQAELLALSASASRSLVPTGFSFLSLQDSYQLALHYPWKERWTFDAGVRSIKSSEPQVVGPTVEQSYVDGGVTAAWLFTEKWTLSLHVSRVSSKYSTLSDSVAASGISVQLSRTFDPIKWH
jgi:hypothetical protein